MKSLVKLYREDIKKELSKGTVIIEIGKPVLLVMNTREKTYKIVMGWGEQRRAFGILMKEMGYTYNLNLEGLNEPRLK